MASLSVVMIVKNEAANLEQALSTVDWADEIIVVDSGSTDDTLDIARQYTQHVYSYDDWPGFGVQRQRAQSHASSDWILMLDADERVTPELRMSIQKVMNEDDQRRVYALPRLSYVFGRFIRHSGWYPDYVIRLYPRQKASYGDQQVHEKLNVPEHMSVVKLNGDLLHYTYRDMEHYLTKSANYAAAWARQREAKGKRSSILQGLGHGLSCFMMMYIFRLGFLDGRQGFLLAILSAHSTFVKYADLWIRNQDKHSA